MGYETASDDHLFCKKDTSRIQIPDASFCVHRRRIHSKLHNILSKVVSFES